MLFDRVLLDLRPRSEVQVPGFVTFMQKTL